MDLPPGDLEALRVRTEKGKSQCFEVHERDDPFSFHNCCMSACMDGDVIQEGVRRNIPEHLIKAVDKVCKFD